VPVGEIAKYSFDPSRAWLLPSQSSEEVSESRK